MNLPELQIPPTVVIWIIVAVWGAVISIRLVKRSIKDIRSLENRSNGRRALAKSRLIRESNRFFISSLYVIAGLCSANILPWRFLIVPILILGSFAMVVNSIVDDTTRASLFHRRGKEKDIKH